MTERADYYYSIEDEDGGFAEGHILCTSGQAERLEKAILRLEPSLIVYVQEGGEYDYIFDDKTDVDGMAMELLIWNGFRELK